MIVNAEQTAAAREVQRVLRGHRRRMRFWDARGGAENEGAHRAAQRIEKRWRGVVGRRVAVRRWRGVEFLAAARIAALYRGFRGRGIALQARVARSHAAAARVQRCYRSRALELGNRESARQRVVKIQSGWRGLVGRRSAAKRGSEIRATIDRLEAAAAAREMISTDPIVAAHELAAARNDYGGALDLLATCRGPAALHAAAIASHLSWLEDPRRLDRALRSLETERRLDYSYWEDHFWVAARMWRPRDARILCALAIIAQTTQPRDRVRRLFARAMAADPTPQIRACVGVFEALFAAPRRRLPATRRVSNVAGGKTFVLEIFAAGPKLVCSGGGGGGGSGDARLPEYVVHEDEFCRADYVLSQLVVVSRPARLFEEEEEDPRERYWEIAFPALERRRASKRARLAGVETARAARIQRLYRAFEQRSLYSRTIFRLREKERQAADLAARRARARLDRLERGRRVARVQAATRRNAARRRATIVKAAVVLIQSHVRRAVVARLGRAEREFQATHPEVVRREGRTLPTGEHLLLIVARSGLNFKFVGHDLSDAAKVAVGFVYRTAVLRLLRTTNIRPYEYHRIAGLLLDHLALATPIRGRPACYPRNIHNKILVCVPEPSAVVGFGAQQKRDLGRGLADTTRALDRHAATREARDAARRARGLPPISPRPSPQQRAIAQASFKMHLYNNNDTPGLFVKAGARAAKSQARLERSASGRGG